MIWDTHSSIFLRTHCMQARRARYGAPFHLALRQTSPFAVHFGGKLWPLADRPLTAEINPLRSLAVSRLSKLSWLCRRMSPGGYNVCK